MMGKPELLPDEKRSFQFFLAAYATITRKISRDLAQHTELTLEQYDVLVTLEYEDEGKLRLSDLADRVLLSRSGLTRMIDRLETRGWVSREGCSRDRRGAYAVLTPEGRQIREDSWPVLQASMKRHFRDPLQNIDNVREFGRLSRLIAFGEDPSGFRWDV
jgi:DNA-binding MarR family transcriptional regulator